MFTNQASQVNELAKPGETCMENIISPLVPQYIQITHETGPTPVISGEEYHPPVEVTKTGSSPHVISDNLYRENMTEHTRMTPPRVTHIHATSGQRNLGGDNLLLDKQVQHIDVDPQDTNSRQVVGTRLNSTANPLMQGRPPDEALLPKHIVVPVVTIDNPVTTSPSSNNDIFTFHLPQTVDRTIAHMSSANLFSIQFTTQPTRVSKVIKGLPHTGAPSMVESNNQSRTDDLPPPTLVNATLNLTTFLNKFHTNMLQALYNITNDCLSTHLNITTHRNNNQCLQIVHRLDGSIYMDLQAVYDPLHRLVKSHYEKKVMSHIKLICIIICVRCTQTTEHNGLFHRKNCRPSSQIKRLDDPIHDTQILT